MKITNMVRKWFGFKGDRQNDHKYLETFDENITVLSGFKIDIRSGKKDGRLIIGNSSVVDCKIIFERNDGVVKIGENTFIGGSNIICAKEIIIGSNVLISWGCTIIDHDSHSLSWQERVNDVKAWREGLMQGGLKGATLSKKWDVVSVAPVAIDDKAWIGFNVIILKGIHIGEGAVIGAGSVVTKDVPPWTLVAGNPARVIRELPHEEQGFSDG